MTWSEHTWIHTVQSSIFQWCSPLCWKMVSSNELSLLSASYTHTHAGFSISIQAFSCSNWTGRQPYKQETPLFCPYSYTREWVNVQVFVCKNIFFMLKQMESWYVQCCAKVLSHSSFLPTLARKQEISAVIYWNVCKHKHRI